MWRVPASLLFFHYLVVTCSGEQLIQMAGYEGRSVDISCPYPEDYQSHEKYLCREGCSDNDVLVTTTEGGPHKYSISDNTQTLTFTVTISSLSLLDVGQYWCGVTRSGKDLYTEVRVTVLPDKCCDSVHTVQVYAGDSMSIECPYQSEHQNSFKYFCRGSQPSTCQQQALITSELRNGTFSLNDNRTSRIFTVTTGILTQEDSGMYLCGIRGYDGLDAFTAVMLEVKDCCDSLHTVQVYAGDPVSIDCPYQSGHQKRFKYFCRGSQPSTCRQQVLITSEQLRNGTFSLTDNKTSRILTVTTGILTQEDSGMYLCGIHGNNSLDVYTAVKLVVKKAEAATSLVVLYAVLAVLVPVLLFAAGLMLCRWTRRKTPGGAAPDYRAGLEGPETCHVDKMTGRPPANHKSGVRIDSEYTEHRNNQYRIRDHGTKAPKTNKVKSAERNTKESDQPMYGNLGECDDIYCNQ